MITEVAANLYIGLMSGTSVDGIDAGLFYFDNEQCQLIASHCHDIPASVRHSLLNFNSITNNELNIAAELDRKVGFLFADAVTSLLKSADIHHTCVAAIGSHGQTLRHQPPASSRTAFSLQIGDPNTIAALTNIPVISDFRRKDIALNGQGAPLAPLFHAKFFPSATDKVSAVINLGGIANITIIKNQQAILGFDTGPSNCLMDEWTQTHLQSPYDKNGEWASGAEPHRPLLDRLLADDYFQQQAPKSTGRDYFNLDWLTAQSNGLLGDLNPQQVQATLLELTAVSLCQQTINHQPKNIYLCGGGAQNKALVTRIQQLLPASKVMLSNEVGIHSDWVEAATFAWLAKCHLEHTPVNTPPITGASRQSILGTYTPV